MSWWKITEGIPEKQEELVTYNLCKNGIFMTKKIAGGGLVTIKVDGIPGLPEGDEDIKFLKRPIPSFYLRAAIRFFQEVWKNFGASLEAYVIIGYSNAKDEYKLWVPEHKVTGGSVDYDIEKFSAENPGYHIVMDIHSHPSFGAFFSDTDNRDDIRDRFSGVIGQIDKLDYMHKFRFSANGKYWEFDRDDLFINDGFKDPDCGISLVRDLKKISGREAGTPFRVTGKAPVARKKSGLK